MQHNTTLDELTTKYKAFIFSEQILLLNQNIIATIKFLINFKLVFFICDTIHTSLYMQQKLAMHGLVVDNKFILTSGDLAKNILCDNRHPIIGFLPRVYHLGDPDFFDNDTEILTKIILVHSIHEAQILLITKQAIRNSIDTDIASTIDLLTQAAKANIVAIMTDATDQIINKIDESNNYIPNYYTNIYQKLNGRIYSTSKPNNVIFYKALIMLAALDIKTKADILFFAQNYQADLAGAYNAGIDTAIIHNYFHSDKDIRYNNIQPKYIVDLMPANQYT